MHGKWVNAGKRGEGRQVANHLSSLMSKPTVPGQHVCPLVRRGLNDNRRKIVICQTRTVVPYRTSNCRGSPASGGTPRYSTSRASLVVKEKKRGRQSPQRCHGQNRVRPSGRIMIENKATRGSCSMAAQTQRNSPPGNPMDETEGGGGGEKDPRRRRAANAPKPVSHVQVKAKRSKKAGDQGMGYLLKNYGLVQHRGGTRSHRLAGCNALDNDIAWVLS